MSGYGWKLKIEGSTAWNEADHPRDETGRFVDKDQVKLPDTPLVIKFHGKEVWREDGKYSPDQPRVPAGSSTGGRWTSSGSVSSFPEGAEQNAARLGSHIGDWTVDDDEEYVSERTTEVIDWMKDEYGEYDDDWYEIDYSSVENALLGWAIDSHHRDALLLHVAAEQEFGSPISDYTKQEIGRDTSNWDMTNERRALRKIYDDTQHALQRMGIDTVVLYRGIQSDPKEYMERATSNALEAWTTDRKIAEMYKERVRGATQKKGAVVAAVFPAERILSLPNYGLGVPSVKEVVVLGGKPVPIFEVD